MCHDVNPSNAGTGLAKVARFFETIVVLGQLKDFRVDSEFDGSRRKKSISGWESVDRACVEIDLFVVWGKVQAIRRLVRFLTYVSKDL